MGETALRADANMSPAAGSQLNSSSKSRQGCLCIMRRVYPEVSLCLRWYHPPFFSFAGSFMRIGISMCTEERCLSHLFSVSSEISFCSLMQNTSELKEKPEMALRLTRWGYFSRVSSFQHAGVHTCFIIQTDRCRLLLLWQVVLVGCFNRRKRGREPHWKSRVIKSSHHSLLPY